MSYSQQVAEANDATDPDATTLGQETVYMYMSHFFDLPTVCGDNTAVYPDWITNDDRRCLVRGFGVADRIECSPKCSDLVDRV